MMDASLRLRLDGDAFHAAIAELSEFERSTEVLPEVRERFLDALDLLPEWGCVKADEAATGAGELVVRLEPSEGLCRLLAAVRAGNV